MPQSVHPRSGPYTIQDYDRNNQIHILKKSVILEPFLDLGLGLYTLTICLRSCYEVYIINFYVTRIPFAHHRI